MKKPIKNTLLGKANPLKMKVSAMVDIDIIKIAIANENTVSIYFLLPNVNKPYISKYTNVSKAMTGINVIKGCILRCGISNLNLNKKAK
jgi:hypothetical protein